jgi:hypothetical protein
MDSKQKERVEYILKVYETQEPFKDSTHRRAVELLSLRHGLAKEIIVLKDAISRKRYEERKSLLMGKRSETTLH